MEDDYEIVQRAYKYGIVAHAGQLDDGGNNYFRSHCMQVFEIIQILYPYDYNLHAAALLHDTIEDTDTTYETLKRVFNEDVANLVNEVTHERKADDTGWYFPRLRSIRGCVLKFADRASNLSRMEGVWNEKRISKYLAKSKFWTTED